MHLTEPIGPCMYSIYTSSLKAFTWLQVHSIREAIFHIRSLLWRPTIYPILIDRGCKIRTELFRNCCLFSCSTVVIIGIPCSENIDGRSGHVGSTLGGTLILWFNMNIIIYKGTCATHTASIDRGI